MKGYQQYSKVYQRSVVNTTDQRKLIVLMYDGAIKFLSLAVKRMEKQEIYESHVNMVRAKSIIAELLCSLDLENGGDIAQNLQGLYTYMFNQLVEANLNKDIEGIGHVIELLKELRKAWQIVLEDREDPRKTPAPEGQKKILVQG